MTKIRHIIVSMFGIIYLIMFFMKIEIPRTIFITLLSAILISQAIDEWNIYKETKNKIHLLIPITLLIVVIFILIKILFQFASLELCELNNLLNSILGFLKLKGYLELKKIQRMFFSAKIKQSKGKRSFILSSFFLCSNNAKQKKFTKSRWRFF